MHTPRQRIGRGFLGCLLIAAVAITLYVSFHRRQGLPPRQGPNTDSRPHVYLWQRAWTDSVKRAIPLEAPAFGRIVVLSRQIDFDRTPPHITRVGVDWPALKAAGTPVAAALRIGAYPGQFDGPTNARLTSSAGS